MMSLLAALLCAGAATLIIRPSSARRLRRVTASTPTPDVSVWRILRRWWRARLPGARDRRRRLVIEGCAALAAELRSGRPMRAGLLAALDETAPHTVAAARWGGDVPEALRRDAIDSGVPLWRSVAACWEVSEASGAALAAALDRLTAGARAAEEVRVQLAAHLAAPRATARMLALLPAIGLLLGMSLGADPVGWLLSTGIGRMCLTGGVVLTLVGLWWVRRIAASVERGL